MPKHTSSDRSPRSSSRRRVLQAARRVFSTAALTLPVLLVAPLHAPLHAQTSAALPVPTLANVRLATRDTVDLAPASIARPTVPEVSRFRSVADSVAGERTRDLAEKTLGLRVVVLLNERQLAVLDGMDTLMVAPVATGMDTTIAFGSKSWTFETPRGRRTVLRKEKDPVWTPPEWHYAEVAGKRGLQLAHLKAGRTTRLADGRALTIRGGRVGILADGQFTALPTDEEIVFDNTLFVPPQGTANRRIPGELGRFKLDLGNGYLLHGTPYENTIGDAATHGCVRLYEEDITWLYDHVPVGTPVFIY